MKLTVEKILSSLLVAIFSFFFGYSPLYLAKRYDLSNSESSQFLLQTSSQADTKNYILSFLMNLAGGVLLANCFGHWLPEVREGLVSIHTLIPLPETILLCGFFFISALEEIIYHFLTSQKSGASQEYGSMTGSCESNDSSSFHADDTKTASKLKSALRTAFTVIALSFHSIIEGFVLGIGEESSSVWINAVATGLHKFVMAFSVGVDLVSNKASTTVYNIYTLTFGFAGFVGTCIGAALTSLASSENLNISLQIIQGVASGVILYVVFFEIFPKAKTTGGTGKQHVIAMTTGFLIFLPILYFHGYVEKE